MPRTPVLLRFLLILALALLGLGAPAAQAAAAEQQAADQPAPTTPADLLAARLVHDFFESARQGDMAARAAMLAPHFQTLSAVGDVYEAGQFRDTPLVFEDYAIDDLAATHFGELLVTTYTAAFDTTMDGGEADFGAPARHLSVFQRIDGEWKMVAHANHLAAELPVQAPPAASAAGSGTTATESARRPSARPTPAAEEPVAPSEVEIADQALADELVTAFFDANKAGDDAARAAMLAPDFQLTRASGEAYSAAEYLADLRNYEDYTISDLHATRGGDVLVVTYNVALDSTMDGAADLSAPAPRMTVFQVVDGRWMMAAHANFAPPAEVAGPPADVAAADAAETGAAATTDTAAVAADTEMAEMDDAALAAELLAAFVESGRAGSLIDRIDLLAPGFQIVRSSGEVYDLAEYGRQIYEYEDYLISDLHATRSGDILVVSYILALDTVHDGVPGFSPPAPRLSVFQQIDGQWKMVAHANFAQPEVIAAAKTGAPDEPVSRDEAGAAMEAAPEAAAIISVEDTDGGKSIELAAGERLDVALAANPSTGYMWRVTQVDEAVLRLTGEGEFEASSAALGAPGIMHFVFDAVAPGATQLVLGYFPPGGDTADLQYSLDVTVK